MRVHNPVFHAAGGRAAPTLFRIRFALTAAAVSLLIAGCTQTAVAPLAAKDPADPGARVPRVGYRGKLGSYTSQRPVEPSPWRQQNERVAPANKP